jgi:quinol monooxygenase YgiN
MATTSMNSAVHIRLLDMLIIAGYLEVSPTGREAYVQDCLTAVQMALAAPGCLDYSITADSIDPARIRVYERWENEERLLAFRGSGPSDGQQAAIVNADVKRYGVDSVSEP